MVAGRLDSSMPVAVIGAGSMGAGIAQLAAQAGHDVRLHDAQPGAAERALVRIDADLAGAVAKGRLDEAERTAIRARLTAVDGPEALAGCGLAVEAIVEQLEPKKALFRRLEGILGDGAVLATNTSSISITAIAQGLAHPERVVGWHFFNPPTRMKLVEVIRGVETDPAVATAMHALSKAWGKTSVDAPNAPGFIVNRVARPYYAEGLRLLAENIAAPQAIDRMLRDAGGFALGPFELIDLIGADVNLSVTESVFAATGWDTRYAPNLIQQELVRAGRYGRKSGQGFYDYREGARLPVAPLVMPAAQVPKLHRSELLGLLALLVERIESQGTTSIAVDVMLPAETLRIGDTLIALTDGRTLAERARAIDRPMLLLDLARDYATTTIVGAAGPADALASLAAALQPAGIGVVELADVAGLVVMRIVACLANEAADVMTWTRTTAVDIDAAMRLGTAYPIGPLAWADAIGVSRVAGVLERLQAHYGDARYRRSPQLLARHFGEARFHG
ncbi:MAG: 3-hydroxyacyl-CoA dehydrogenase [Proteobacteria bacterium]|nr:3-hydroxyacyl-CoA dehydrogenase [Pseudomonadota bacterium]